MNRIYIFSLLAFFALSCSSDKVVYLPSTSSPVSNMLLPEVLEVNYAVDLDTTASDSWQKSFDSRAFLSEFMESVYRENIPVYSPFYNDTAGALITAKYLEMDLGNFAGNKEYKWGSYRTWKIGFTEQWHFDTSEVKFTKLVKWWYPLFYSPADSSNHTLFRVSSGPSSEILAENMICEVRFDDAESDFSRMDAGRFFDWMVRAAVSKKIEVFPPDTFSSPLTPETIRQRLGEGEVSMTAMDDKGNATVQTVLQKYNLNELKGMIFIEDWYYSKSTGCLSKTVTGFAPVRYYEDENGRMLKSIPFVFYTGEKKVAVL